METAPVLEPIETPRAACPEAGPGPDGEGAGQRARRLDAFLADFAGTSSHWAWSHYKALILHLVEHHHLRRLLEVGGGRSPTLSLEETRRHSVAYTINDISAHELRLAPAWAAKAEFDITGRVPAGLVGQYDLIFSKMVLEHVESASDYYGNACQLLDRGGILLTHYPTLCSPPFLINKALPDVASRKILDLFFDDRHDDAKPKFPARYSWCYSTRSMENRIRNLGFSYCRILPFYGHGYFAGIPVVREIDRAISTVAEALGIRLLSSYAFSLCIK